MLMSTARTEYKLSLQTDNFSPNTVAGYDRDVLAFEEFCKAKYGRALAAHVTADNAEAFKVYLATRQENPLRPPAIRRKLAALRSFGRWGASKKRRYWEGDPTLEVTLPKIGKRLPRPYKQEEVHRLLALELPPKEAALRAVLFYTGLRNQEVCDLRVCDLDLPGLKLTTIGKGNKQATVPLNALVAEALDAYFRACPPPTARSFVFRHDQAFQAFAKSKAFGQRRQEMAAGRPYTRAYMAKVTQKWGDRAGVLNCEPHRFRHTLGTFMYRATKDLLAVRDVLRHADIATTQMYVELANEGAARAVAAVTYGVPAVTTPTAGVV